MMEASRGSNHRVVRHNGKEYRILWDSLSIASPEGATVIVADMSRPRGQRKIFEKQGDDGELETLKAEAEEFIKAIPA